MKVFIKFSMTILCTFRCLGCNCYTKILLEQGRTAFGVILRIIFSSKRQLGFIKYVIKGLFILLFTFIGRNVS